MVVTKECPVCNGFGYIECPDCTGMGVIAGFGTCPRCEGDCVDTCYCCDGSGQVEDEDFWDRYEEDDF